MAPISWPAVADDDPRALREARSRIQELLEDHRIEFNGAGEDGLPHVSQAWSVAHLDPATHQANVETLDGIAEIVDCLRGSGMTEASDPMVCEGTLLLLDFQRKNGSWPAWLPGEEHRSEKELDSYHRVHPTWVCTQCLRDRDFRIADNQFWPEFISKCLKDTQFHKLLYKPTW